MRQPTGELVPTDPGCSGGRPTWLLSVFACACDRPGVCNIGAPCPSERYVVSISFNVTSRYTRDVLAAAASYGELYGARPLVASDQSLEQLLPAAAPVVNGPGSE